MVAVNYDWDEPEDNIVEEYDDAGTVVAEYTNEPSHYGNVISQNRGGVESQYHFDAIGSSLALTDFTEQNTDTFAYSAFGEMTERTGSSANPFQYVGQKGYYKDLATSQYMVRRRRLTVQQARWTSQDPLGSQAGSHIYTYVSNNPVLLLDPSGLVSVFAKSIELSNGGCGQFRWDIDWSVRDCDQSGFIVQNMWVGWECRDCNNKVLKNQPKFKYSEVWYVHHDPSKQGENRCRIYSEFCESGNQKLQKGQKRDLWCFDGCDVGNSNRLSAGDFAMHGDAFFVPLSAFDSTGYSFAGYKWAGCLLSKGGEDSDAKGKKLGSASLRSVGVSWHCCSDVLSECPGYKKCRTEVAGSWETEDEPLMTPPFPPDVSNRCASTKGVPSCPDTLDVTQCPCFGKKPDPGSFK